ncbi:hypothetical protein J6590_006484 [Homalodisca vitripennis]|nr:hypothetical protein J6590_006484 [Homalodisca vitripennis]
MAGAHCRAARAPYTETGATIALVFRPPCRLGRRVPSSPLTLKPTPPSLTHVPPCLPSDTVEMPLSFNELYFSYPVVISGWTFLYERRARIIPLCQYSRGTAALQHAVTFVLNDCDRALNRRGTAELHHAIVSYSTAIAAVYETVTRSIVADLHRTGIDRWINNSSGGEGRERCECKSRGRNVLTLTTPRNKCDHIYRAVYTVLPYHRRGRGDLHRSLLTASQNGTRHYNYILE